LGAEVSLWKASYSKGWSLDLGEPKSMIKANTKLIIIKEDFAA